LELVKVNNISGFLERGDKEGYKREMLKGWEI
jgi:hypothetical protein